MRTPRPRIAALALGLLLAAATAGHAVVIYFKDGSKEILAASYRIDGDRMIATLQSGLETSIPLAEIDLARTESLGRVAKGAVVIETTNPDGTHATPGREPTLRDVMRGPSTKAPAATRDATRAPRLTPAGNVDLFSAARRPVAPPARAEAVTALLARKGLHDAQVFQGTAPDRVLVHLVTASRGEVFSALEACAVILLELRASSSGVAALELAMATSTRSRAGQFVLTPEEAERLQSGAVTPAEHFVANVLF